MDRIDESLQNHLKNLNDNDTVDVIIVLNDAEDISEKLKKIGFHTSSSFPELNTITGSIQKKNIVELTGIEKIKKIELDSETSTLS